MKKRIIGSVLMACALFITLTGCQSPEDKETNKIKTIAENHLKDVQKQGYLDDATEKVMEQEVIDATNETPKIYGTKEATKDKKVYIQIQVGGDFFNNILSVTLTGKNENPLKK